jgi:hypothetical protein
MAVDDLAGHDQLLGVAEPDDGRQTRAAAHVGQQSHPHLHDPGHGVLGHDAEVAGERELERAAERSAVDLADRRLRHLLQQVPPLQDRAPVVAQVGRVLRQLAQVVEVHSRREQRPLAAHYHHADGVVGRGLLDRAPERSDRLLVERIPFLGPVEHQVPDRPPVFHLYECHGVWGGYCSGKEGSA